MRFRLVGLSTLSVSTTYLKYLHMGNHTISRELHLSVEVVVGTICLGGGNSGTRNLSVNNKQPFTERQRCNNNISNIYIYIYIGCLKIDVNYRYDNWYCVKASFIWVLKSNYIISERSNQMTKVESDWPYPTVHVKDQILWSVFRWICFALFSTESLTTYTLSGNLAVNFFPDLWFSTFLLRLFTEPVA